MEVLRHLRPEGLIRRAFGTLLIGVFALQGCAGTQSSAAPLRPVVRGPQWPVKTREHVDLWLHGFALISDDTATVPLFARGYATQLTIEKNQRRVYTVLDSTRVTLQAMLRTRPQLEGAQFAALYFASWPEMKQAFDYFLKAEGEPRNASNREVQGIIAFLAQQFPRKEDRAFAELFVAALSDEQADFHHQWWLEQQRSRTAGLAAADSLWQSKWRPALQPYLNHTQQGNGDLLVSLVLAGEGRAVPAGKNLSQYAVSWPATADAAEEMLFTFAHEAASPIAAVAVNDHLTPAQQREGTGARLAATGLVRGGALIVEKIDPALAERYARFYLVQAGKAVPSTGALAALAAAFPMPDDMVASMKRQIDLAFTGI
jgi:hypothetical protein